MSQLKEPNLNECFAGQTGSGDRAGVKDCADDNVRQTYGNKYNPRRLYPTMDVHN